MTQATLRKPLQVNAERLGQARELIAAGTTMREAAAAVALANSTLYYHGLRADPEHLRRRRAETARIGARWDRDRILAAISDWEELYGAPPAVVDWHPAMARRKGHPDRAERYAAGAWPSYSTVIYYFGAWSAAAAVHARRVSRARGLSHTERGLDAVRGS